LSDKHKRVILISLLRFSLLRGLLADGGTVPADLENAAVEAGAPNPFFGPISFKIFRDPVMLPTGHSWVPPLWVSKKYSKSDILLPKLVTEMSTVSDLCRYERQYIQRWLDQGNTTCPITQEALARPVQLTPNVALRHAIEDWAERNAIWLLVRQQRA
jgi:hypothetical protein